jgi:hypothetical protein
MELGSLPVKVSIEGDPPREPDVEDISCLLLENATDASGQIRGPGATARAHLWRSLREGSFYSRAGFLAFVVLLSIADVPPRPPAWAILVFVVLVIDLAIEVVVRIERSVAWSRALAQYLAALPPAGTRIQVTKDGITIGPAHTPWQSLRLEEAVLRKFWIWRRFWPWRCRVDRLRLGTLDGSVVLDPVAIEAGQTIVDTIWRRLGMPT